ncbi:hypothetical protein ABK040_008350 [Willaertia magna]
MNFGWGQSTQPQQQQQNPVIGNSAAGVNMSQINPNEGDYCLPDLPSDSISQISWCPTKNFIAASSWDGSVTCWEVQVQSNGNQAQFLGQGRLKYKHEAPALCCCVSGDGKVLSGGCDNKAKYQQLGQTNDVVIGQHEQPIKVIRSLDGTDNMNTIVVTGSWDKNLKFWDLRQTNGQAVGTVQQKDKIYDLNVVNYMAVVALANKEVLIYDLRKPSEVFKQCVSPLREQTRCIACFPDASGFAIGSIEGRVGINYLPETAQRKNFAFKCHREGQNVFSINAISFHPLYHTFSTSGADGTFHFWDHVSKQRLHQFKKLGNDLSIVSTGFSGDGNIFAYAASYDWSKGHEYYKNHAYVFLHYATESQVKPKR